MADMELIIKIPEEMYQKIKQTSRFISGRRSGKRFDYILFNAVNNGTPLPKGHGRLKDIDKIINDGISKGFCNWYDEMKDAETIIEADAED